MPTLLVLGVGPGLGLSIAHRFGREGYTAALVSRSDTRHATYRKTLAEAGIAAETYVADVRDRDRLLSTLDAIGPVDVVYYGAGAADIVDRPKTITETTAADVERAMTGIYPAVDVVSRVLPHLVAQGSGGLLFAGGLSAVRPMPALGAYAVSSAALRNYVVTLHAALAGTGVYAGTLTIGGLIARGDIHQLVAGEMGHDVPTLDPDDIAETAWRLYTERDRAEAVIS